MDTNSYSYILILTHKHKPTQQIVEALQTHSPVRAVWEVDGTLWQVPHCDVTAMASVGWLEGWCLSFTLLFGFDDFC